MNAVNLRTPALVALALMTLSRGALAQPKAAPPPELPSATAAPDAPAKAPDAPADDDDAKPAPARELENDRGALPQQGPLRGPPAGPPPQRRAMAADRAIAPEDAPDPGVGALQPPAELPPEPAGPPHKQRFSLGLGFRGGVVSSPGYDPYSSNDSLPMASLHGTFTPWPTRPVAFSLVAEWDYGSSEATARGVPSSFDMHRVALGLESRYTPITRMAFFARVIPAAIRAGATVEDPYLANKLEASAWTWGVDVTGGAAVRVGAVGTNENPLVSFWLALDMGYRFAGTTSMRFRPGDLTEEDQTRRFGEIPLTDLDLSGFIGRFSLSISF